MSSPAVHVPCPFCREPIRAEAVKCRHCRRMLTPKQPPKVPWISRDLVVPVIVVLGGISAVAYFVAMKGRGVAPRPEAAATAPAPEPPPVAEPLARPPAPPPRPPPAEVAPGPAEPPSAVPPRRAPRPAPRRDLARAPAPGPEPASPPPAPAAAPAPAPEPRPGRARELKSDVFGYGIQLPNEDAWEMGLAGISRHTLVRRDGTARIEVWVDLYTQAMSGETCLRRHLSWLQRRFARASLKVRSAPVHIRSTSGGLRVHHTEREALGPGPRRHAGRYLLAFAADGRLCHGFQAFAAVPASRAARREVRRAFQTFDVDPAVRGKARTEEVRLRVRRLALGAEKSGNPILLLDASTALAGLWPEDALGWQLLGTALLAVDRPADALHSFDLARRGRIEGGPEEGRLRRFGLWTLTADAYARMRKWPEADGALDEARKILPDHPGLAYAQGCLHALRGRVERAIDSLEASFRSWPTRPAPPRIPHGLGVQVALARRDARLASLRREPRFEVLLRRFEARARKGQ